MAAIEAHNTQLGVLPLPVHPAHDRLQHHKPTDTTQDRVWSQALNRLLEDKLN